MEEKRTLRSVWVIEDNPNYRTTLVALIDDTAGMECPHAFSTCEDAIRCLNTEPPPAVVLLDIGLPGMSGIEGIGRIKLLSSSTQIIILTVHDDSANVFNAICAGASGYLVKDLPPDKIIGAIHEVLEGGAPMNPHIARKVLEMFSRRPPAKDEYGLTGREREILKMIVDGSTKKKIAERLFISFHTVNTHMKNIYHKLHVTTRTHAVSKVYLEKLL